MIHHDLSIVVGVNCTWSPASCPLDTRTLRIERLCSCGITIFAWQGSRTISAWSECLALRSRMVDMRMTKGLSFLFWLKTCLAILRWTEWWFQKFRLQHDWNVIMVGKSRTNGTVKSTTGVLINHRLKGFKMFLSVSGRFKGGNSDQSTTISTALLASLFRIEFVAITALDISHSLILIIMISPCWLFDMALIHMGPVPRLLNPIACRF